MIVNIQASRQTYKQRSDKLTGKWEQTEYTDKKEQNGAYTREGKVKEGKDTRTLLSNDKTNLWYILIS